VVRWILAQRLAGHTVARGSENLLYAVRIAGTFGEVSTRTVREQKPPYPPLTQATQGQQETTFNDVTGTLAGYRTPDYEQGISVAGYHLHFIDSGHAHGGHAHGGHALDYRLEHGKIEISSHSQLHLSLPQTPQFLDSNLTPGEHLRLTWRSAGHRLRTRCSRSRRAKARNLLRLDQAGQQFVPGRQRPARQGECQQMRGMRVDHRTGLWPCPVHQRVHGHDLGAHPAQVAFGHAPVQADHGEVIGHGIACLVQRGDQHSVGPDPGREVSVTGACPGVVISASL
jgi:Alpha-acetolactate decarboxylase